VSGEASVSYRVGDGRYEAVLDGEVVGVCVWRDDDGIRTLTHTQVDDGHEGHGIGTGLIEAALADIRERGLALVPQCPMVAAYVEQHAEAQDLVVR